jgi:hypothetical protein
MIISTTKENLKLKKLITTKEQVSTKHYIKTWDQQVVHKFPCQKKSFFKKIILPI